MLGFPFVFWGALDVRASAINGEMMVANQHGSGCTGSGRVPDVVAHAYGLETLSFGPTYLIPKPLDPRVALAVAPAVAEAAIDTGVARRTVDMASYREELAARFGRGREVMRIIVHKARGDPSASSSRRATIPASSVLRRPWFTMAYPALSLIGDPERIHGRMAELRAGSDFEVIDIASSPDLDRYAATLFALRQRKE